MLRLIEGVADTDVLVAPVSLDTANLLRHRLGGIGGVFWEALASRADSRSLLLQQNCRRSLFARITTPRVSACRILASPYELIPMSLSREHRLLSTDVLSLA